MLVLTLALVMILGLDREGRGVVVGTSVGVLMLTLVVLLAQLLKTHRACYQVILLASGCNEVFECGRDY